METSLDLTKRRMDIEYEEGWRSIAGELPAMQFDSDWAVKVIPPFGGAVARMVIVNSHGAKVSVYADYFNRLGAPSFPYWEAYQVEGDQAVTDEDEPMRFMIAHVDVLMDWVRSRGDPARIAIAALGGLPDA